MGCAARGGISAPSKASPGKLRRTSACARGLSIAHPSRWGRKRKTKHAKGWRGLRADHRFAPPQATTVFKEAEATSAPCMRRRCVIYRLWPDRRAAFRGGQDAQSGTTAVASISPLARSCISATTCTQPIAEKVPGRSRRARGAGSACSERGARVEQGRAGLGDEVIALERLLRFPADLA